MNTTDARKESRRARLHALLTEKFGGVQKPLADTIDIQESLLSRYLSGKKGLGEEMVEKIETTTGFPGWFSQQGEDQKKNDVNKGKLKSPRNILIPQYDTGGAMGHGFALSDEPPGLIQSWGVSPDWLRLNVPLHTGLQNLCIITGFGPSMQPRFNPGDPLLCDRGVTDVRVDGVYFFRLCGHGFVKQLQRIPTSDGMVLRAKSFNPDYEPITIQPGDDFQVLGRILTVWRSEQF